MSSEPSLEDLQDSLMTELEALNRERLGLIKIKHATWLAIAGQPPPAPLVYQDGNILHTMNNLNTAVTPEFTWKAPNTLTVESPSPPRRDWKRWQLLSRQRLLLVVTLLSARARGRR